MSEKTILVWFRNDLRIHDNEILLEATKKADKIVPVYCFDPDYFATTSIGTLKTGAVRAKFIIESVANLRHYLQELGGDLIVKIGRPEDILPQIVQKYAVTEVYHHREVASEETDTSGRVEAALWKLRINLKHFIGHTMYHKEDLPFPVKDIPDVFATFKKKIERESVVRPCFPAPELINIPPGMEHGEIPALADLNLTAQKTDPRSALDFKGGETEGLQRLASYFGEDNISRTHKEVRGTAAYVSRLSPWISLGCLSTRKVYWEIRANEHRVSKEAVNWQMLELLRRDYFRFMFKKHSNEFSSAKDIGELPSGNTAVSSQFLNWKNAETGIPYIDAVMTELNATGYITNYCRQSAANYLINTIGEDWPLGAAYFEEKLIDYSPASNWGNWSYLARAANQVSNIQDYISKQAGLFDPCGDYVRKWVPSLASV